MQSASTWLIGSADDCDLVEPAPSVSGHHCLLKWAEGEYVLEDLGSTNGTFVDGRRIDSPTRVDRSNQITLGQSVAMPWPHGENVTPRVVLIGRDPDNDLVIDDPRVSGRHACVRIGASSATVEDLASTNGTFLRSHDHPVTGPMRLSRGDTLYLGSLELPAQRIWDAPMRPAAPGKLEPAPPGPTALGARLAIAVIAPGLVMVALSAFGGAARAKVTVETWHQSAIAVAWLSFVLGLASFWLGVLDGLWLAPLLAGRGDPRLPDAMTARGLAPASALCIFQCFVLVVVARLGAGSQAALPPALGLLSLAAAVGLAVGQLLLAAVAKHEVRLVLILGMLLASFGLGGPIRASAETHPSARIVAACSPVRWAFEGLLILEADRRPTLEVRDPAPPRVLDMADAYFPSNTRRMGPRAAALALMGILAAVVAAVVAIGTPRQGRFVAPEPA